MKIVHICSATLDSGAGMAAFSLHSSLVSAGHDSHFLALVVPNGLHIPNLVKINYLEKLKLFFYRLVERYLVGPINDNSSPFSLGLLGLDLAAVDLIKRADIIHFHWIGYSFVNIRKLLKVRAKIVWTVRDYWPFTAGCHVPFPSCEGFKVTCANCPKLTPFRAGLFPDLLFSFKSSIFSLLSIHWVFLSKHSSMLFSGKMEYKSHKYSVIPSSFDEGVYLTRDQSQARASLGLPLDVKIIAFGSTNVSDSHKGIHLIEQMFEDIRFRNCIFISFGGGSMNHTSDNRRHFGFVSDKLLLANIYSSADVFIQSSMYETFGKTVVESLACGTPVVCFSDTGPASIICRSDYGEVVDRKMPESLPDAVIKVLSRSAFYDRAKLSSYARDFASAKCVLLAHIELYESLT